MIAAIFACFCLSEVTLHHPAATHGLDGLYVQQWFTGDGISLLVCDPRGLCAAVQGLILRKMQSQCLQLCLQARPLKAGSRIIFAPRRNVLMPRNVVYGVVCGQALAQLAERLVLHVLKA